MTDTENSSQAGQPLEGYNFAYLDEGTKRMIRRALLKAVAIPGYQVPFASREMPMPFGWGTGGIQVTASIIGRDDVLKVIDQGADDTTNAVSIRGFFRRTTGWRHASIPAGPILTLATSLLQKQDTAIPQRAPSVTQRISVMEKSSRRATTIPWSMVVRLASVLLGKTRRLRTTASVCPDT